MKKSIPCSDKEISTKAYFLGPQSENSEWLMKQTYLLMQDLFDWRKNCFPRDGVAISHTDKRNTLFLKKQKGLATKIQYLSNLYKKEVPKFSPRYIGHMFSELTLPGITGHMIALLHNPNNVCSDASRVGLKLEKQCIDSLSKMIGYLPQYSAGHFTSGGTIANFEAVLRAKKRVALWLGMGTFVKKFHNVNIPLFDAAHMGWDRYSNYNKKYKSFAQWFTEFENNNSLFEETVSEVFKINYTGPVIIIPEHAHYSWQKSCEYFSFEKKNVCIIPLNKYFQMDPKFLENKIKVFKNNNKPIALIVSVLSTTEFGTIDPLYDIFTIMKKLGQKNHLWNHLDAAYGGFLLTLKDDNKNLMAAKHFQSLTIDPHKLGYIPYSSGTFICKNKRDYYYQKIDAPYVDFNKKLDTGPQTIEGSRSATGVTATWLTANTIGLTKGGLGQILKKSISNKTTLEKKIRLKFNKKIYIPNGLHSNILCFSIKGKSKSLKAINKQTLSFYKKLSRKQSSFTVSKTTLDLSTKYSCFKVSLLKDKIILDDSSMVFIRLCLMNPFFMTKELNTNYIDEFIELMKAHLKTFSSLNAHSE